MKRPDRRVVIATIRGRTVALAAVLDASGFTNSDVRSLCVTAAIEPRTTAHATFIGLSELPDLEALCEVRGVVVVRRRP